MDVLIPFTRTLEDYKSIALARDAAVKGAERMIGLKAKLGRATYVGSVRRARQIRGLGSHGGYEGDV